MPTLNEQRIVKRFNIFPFNHERGRVGWFQTYYGIEEWYKRDGYWGWHLIGVTTKAAYEKFKRDKFVRTTEYSSI